MCNDVAQWYAKLAAIQIPAGETIPDLAGAVKIFLTKIAFQELRANDRDRLQRLCNYWNISEAWLAEWLEIYRPLAAGNDTARLMDWLDHPTMPADAATENRSSPGLSQAC